MQTFYTFKNVRDFQRFLRTKTYKSGEMDYVTVGKKVYTMHEYDGVGGYMSWGNKKHDTIIECNTANRYGATGLTDAKLWKFTKYGGLRNDIHYAE